MCFPARLARIDMRRPRETEPRVLRAQKGAGEVQITAGEFRSRSIECPLTGLVRPMLNKVRQALFNVLADDVVNATVWDCFAGSGLLGLEAISRGAKHCVFVESHRQHSGVIERNIDALGVRTRTSLLRADLFGLVTTAREKLDHAPANLVFLDPPHAMIADPDQGPFWPWLETLHLTPLVNGFTVLVLGHHGQLEMPKEIGAFLVADTRRYGNAGFTILVRSEGPDEEEG